MDVVFSILVGFAIIITEGAAVELGKDSRKAAMETGSWRFATVTSSDPPDVSLLGDPAPDAYLPEGTTVVLTCTTTNFPEIPLITINQSSSCEHTVIGSSESFSLTISIKLDRCHNGESFICEASSGSFKMEDITDEYKVIYPSGSVSIVADPAPEEAFPTGTSVILTCTASDFPDIPQLTIKQSTSCEHTVIASAESLSLKVTVKLESCHNGKSFTCQAIWGFFDMEDSTPEYNVLYPTTSDMADVNPEIYVERGSDQELYCTFYSNPPVLDVTWYDITDEKGEVIKIDELEPRDDDKYTSTLLLTSITSNMTVTCLATQVHQNMTKIRETKESKTISPGNGFTYNIIVSQDTVSDGGESSGSSGLSGGAIAVIIIGIILGVIAVICLTLCLILTVYGHCTNNYY